MSRRPIGSTQWRALPLAYDPGQQWLKARRYDKRAACRPTFGRDLRAQRTQLLAHGRFFAAQPRRQERTDRSQRPGAGQHHAQTPQGQDRRLWLAQMGQVRLDNGGPFGHTGVARPPYPPWGDGSEATSHTMPHRGVSCHLLYAVIPSFFKNLLQKGAWGKPRPLSTSPWLLARHVGETRVPPASSASSDGGGQRGSGLPSPLWLVSPSW
jgi:hypothetical protein